MTELSHQLPTSDERPGCDLVIWDGHCNFCLAQVKRLHRLDWGRLAYISLHDPRVAALAPTLDFDALMSQLWVVSPDGIPGERVQLGGADAMRYLSRKLPLLWPVMPLLHIPGLMPFWRWLYHQIAKRRYKIAGKNCDENGTCHLHRR